MGQNYRGWMSKYGITEDDLRDEFHEVAIDGIVVASGPSLAEALAASRKQYMSALLRIESGRSGSIETYRTGGADFDFRGAPRRDHVTLTPERHLTSAINTREDARARLRAESAAGLVPGIPDSEI